jgi:hypothetical protein
MSVTSFAQHQPTRQAQRGEYSYPTDGFAITLPQAVKSHADPQLPNGFAYTLVGGNPPVGLTLHVATFPEGCRDAYLAFAEPVKQVKRGKIPTPPNSDFEPYVSSIREFQIDGYPAIEFEQNIKSLQRRDYECYLCVNKRLYIFTGSWAKGQQKPSEIKEVVDSFRLLPTTQR